jgi:hypothetical protein
MVRACAPTLAVHVAALRGLIDDSVKLSSYLPDSWSATTSESDYATIRWWRICRCKFCTATNRSYEPLFDLPAGNDDSVRPSAKIRHRKQKEPSTESVDGCSGERRAWDSNPQPLAGHHISSVAAGQFAYPPERVLTANRSECCGRFNVNCEGCVSPRLARRITSCRTQLVAHVIWRLLEIARHGRCKHGALAANPGSPRSPSGTADREWQQNHQSLEARWYDI